MTILDLETLKSLQSLRTLELPALSIGPVMNPNFLKTVLPAITFESRPPPNIVLIYNKSYFTKMAGGITMNGHDSTPFDKSQKDRFALLLQAHTVLNFRLVLCVEVAGSEEEEALRALEEDVEKHKYEYGESCYRRFEPGPSTMETVVSNSTIVSRIPRIDVARKSNFWHPKGWREHGDPFRPPLRVVSSPFGCTFQ